MKCIRCGKDAKKKERNSNFGRCPSCQHPFVSEPAVYGLTDMAIKSTEARVSSNNSLYFTNGQFNYELRRSINKKSKWVVLTFWFIILLIFTFGIKSVKAFILLSAVVGLLSFISLRHQRSKLNKLDELVDKWLRINPPEKLLSAAKFSVNQSPRPSHDLEGISFERVLICEQNEMVDFFLTNLFHFHYACPVLGVKDYPPAICADMLQRLKQNPDLKVFLLHNFSPEGYAFVRRMQTDRQWFGSYSAQSIIDLGLTEEQKKFFKAMTIKKQQKVIAEIALFNPATLIALCGAAINEGVPLHKTTNSADGGGGGYG